VGGSNPDSDGTYCQNIGLLFPIKLINVNVASTFVCFFSKYIPVHALKFVVHSWKHLKLNNNIKSVKHCSLVEGSCLCHFHWCVEMLQFQEFCTQYRNFLSEILLLEMLLLALQQHLWIRTFANCDTQMQSFFEIMEKYNRCFFLEKCREVCKFAQSLNSPITNKK